MLNQTATCCVTSACNQNGVTVSMSQNFNDLVNVIARLRSPGGCPWDLKQTHDSLKPFLLEEAYEVLDALDHQDPQHLREELGDLLLQILLHARIESERGTFSIEDVITGLQHKLVRRHPHVFASGAQDAPTLTADQVVKQWETIKQAERTTRQGPDSALAGIPAALPALLRACQLQQRASCTGFDWNTLEQVTDKLEEELEELRTETARLTPHPKGEPAVPSQEMAAAIEHEFGDVLLTMVSMARFLRIHPEEALRKANERFLKRFQYMERQAAQEGRPLQALTASEWDTLWEAAKRQEPVAASHTPNTPGNRNHE